MVVLKRWDEVSGVVKLYRYVMHVVPAYLITAIRVGLWLVTGASRLKIHDDWIMTHWETLSHIKTATMSIAWTNAGNYSTSEEFIDKLKNSAGRQP